MPNLKPFPLYSTPIDLAHSFWKNILEKGSIAIDATSGNGKDSKYIASLLAPLGGELYCIDMQANAIKETKALIQKHQPEFYPSVHFFERSHETLPTLRNGNKAKLIVYNLGYLPKGDKTITTLTETTLKSLTEAKGIIDHGGLISITCYPGHSEGYKEQAALESFVKKLDPTIFCVSTTYWPNRNAAPSLFLIQKKCSI